MRLLLIRHGQTASNLKHLLDTGEKGEARKIVERGLEDYRYLRGPSRRRDGRWVGKAKQLLKQTD